MGHGEERTPKDGNRLTRRQVLRSVAVAGSTAAGLAGAWAVARIQGSDDTGAGDPAPEQPFPAPSRTPGGWQAAVDTGDYTLVQEWYAANTGHEALGLDYADLAPGSLVSEHDGQVIEGVRSSHILIAHNNVTIRGCRVEGGALHGAYFDPTHDADIVGTVIEYCTYAGDGSDVRANYWSSANAGAVVTRYCNIFGWRSGHTGVGGATFEYSWVHDLSTPEDAHRTGMQISGADCRYRRNYVTDGGSGCAAAYFDVSPMHNSSMEENILNGSSPTASPSYLVNLKSGPHGPSVTNFRLVRNMFGDQYQFGPLSDANVPWGTNDNRLDGNHWFGTDEPISHERTRG